MNGGIEPLERQHPRPGRVGDGLANRVQAALEPVAKLGRPLGDARRLAQAGDVGEHLGEVGGVERDHRGPGRQALGHRDHVVVGDRADLADGLGDDQIDLELGQGRLVELVEVASLAGEPAHRGVDLAGGRGPPGSGCG